MTDDYGKIPDNKKQKYDEKFAINFILIILCLAVLLLFAGFISISKQTIFNKNEVCFKYLDGVTNNIYSRFDLENTKFACNVFPEKVIGSNPDLQCQMQVEENSSYYAIFNLTKAKLNQSPIIFYRKVDCIQWAVVENKK